MAWENGDVRRLDLNAEVSNVHGSSQQKMGSWKQYWSKNTGRDFPKKCQTYNCGNPAEVGAHKYVKHSHQNFILPSCQACNMDPDQGYGKGWTAVKANAVVVRVEPHSATKNSKERQLQ